MGITREYISHRDGETLHSIQIRDFKDKMKRWNPGREVRLKTVYVDGLSLKLEIYPNGYIEEEVNYVSFFIKNLGDSDIKIDFELKIKNASIEGEDQEISAHSKMGLNNYLQFCHDSLLDEYENSDEDLKIQWTIKNVVKLDDGNNFYYNSISDGNNCSNDSFVSKAA